MRSLSRQAVVLLALLVGGCAPEEGQTKVTLWFEHRVNGAPLDAYVLDTPFTNAAGNAFGVTRLVYFVSDVKVTPKRGSPVSASGAHYVDHEDPASRALELGVDDAEAGLGSIAFTMGLPPPLNVTGAFTAPPEALMEWPEMMGGGYHHMKFEGRFVDAGGEVVSFKVHSGPAGGGDYSYPVTLDASALAMSGEAPSLTIVMNLEQWFTNPNTWDLDEQFQPPTYGMMDSPEKQLSLKQNGATVFALEAP